MSHAALSLFAGLLLLATSASGTDFVEATEAWRTARYERLTAPDGYLTYIGSGLVNPGSYRVGSDPDSDLLLPEGPGFLGRLSYLPDGRIEFESAPDGVGRVQGKPFESIEMKTASETSGPSRIDFGSAWFYLVRMDKLIGWRLRDSEAAARLEFAGIPHHEVNPDWRIVADWEVFDPPRELEYLTVLGTPEIGAVPGQAHFEIDGEAFTLQPTEAEDGELFFVFADRSSGPETYGGGRFLYAPAPENGQVVLDFNRAYNPPCALNSHVVCPTAPPENRLRTFIRAGELKPHAD